MRGSTAAEDEPNNHSALTIAYSSILSSVYTTFDFPFCSSLLAASWRSILLLLLFLTATRFSFFHTDVFLLRSYADDARSSVLRQEEQLSTTWYMPDRIHKGQVYSFSSICRDLSRYLAS